MRYKRRRLQEHLADIEQQRDTWNLSNDKLLIQLIRRIPVEDRSKIPAVFQHHVAKANVGVAPASLADTCL